MATLFNILRMMLIVAFCILAAIAYGIAHDQITARICVEYFTIGHPYLGVDDPTLLGIIWGVLATWWVGAILGTLLALVARLGHRPRIGLPRLVRPVLLLLAGMGLCATVAGGVGWLAASRGLVYLVEPLATKVPAEKHVAFLAALWAHLASYFSGFIGGLLVLIWTWRKRRHLSESALLRIEQQ